MAAMEDPGPVLYIDDRWLYGESGEVPAEPFTVAIGEAAVRRRGSDVTLIGVSWMAAECVRAAGLLERDGIDAEVIDLRTLKPWDKETGGRERVAHRRAVVADGGWRTAGASADIAAEVTERCFPDLARRLCGLRCPMRRRPRTAPKNKRIIREPSRSRRLRGRCSSGT